MHQKSSSVISVWLLRGNTGLTVRKEEEEEEEEEERTRHIGRVVTVNRKEAHFTTTPSDTWERSTLEVWY